MKIVMTASNLLAPNLVVASRFRLERPLDEGGMGAVWEATHLRTGERVAVKFLKDAWADDPDMRRRVFREARAASAITHPNVIRVHEIVTTEAGAPALVMDLLRGESLASFLAREQTLGLAELADIFLQVVAAVRAAHEAGVVHRDLKPANVFLADVVGGPRTVRVLDFGIAKVSTKGKDGSTELTRTGHTVGTVQYMAPEQIYGEGELDARADVWSLGVMMYECLAGRRPIEGTNAAQIARALTKGRVTPIAQLRPHLPDALASVIDRMLVVDRKRRLRDLAEVVQALRPWTQTGQDRPANEPTILLTRVSHRRKNMRRLLQGYLAGASPLALLLAVLMASAVFAAGVLAGGVVGGR
jgi:serine/threonine protein kinase